MAKPFTEPAIQKPKDFIPFPKEVLQSSFVHRFEQMARQFPAAMAVHSLTETFTYQKLNETANRLAHTILNQRGQGSEPIVFILEHDSAAILALVGILKAGKAYVPVDPAYPPARIAHILENTRTPLVITNDQNLGLVNRLLEQHQDIEVVNLQHLPVNARSDNPALEISPEDLAYILYTSGSTGQPKGVMHTHRDALHNTFALCSDFHISPSDRFALFITLGFEASRFSIYSALLNGGALCMYDIRSLGLSSLPAWINQQGITVLLSTPSTFRHMFDLVPMGEKLSSVRLIILGGEAVRNQDVRLFRQHFTRTCVLANTLGMTETGVVARYIVDHQARLAGHNVPAGFPTGDKVILVVDEAGKPVGENQVGEILVRSQYLFPGYWADQALTNQKIYTDPGDSRYRIFRTGDLGQRRPDSVLEHLGRKDSQIKIRGYRVDTAEIEAVLEQHPGIRDVAVIARPSQLSPDENQLVAYVVTQSRPAPTKKELIGFVARVLPDYMVPSLMVFMDSLPLTSTGKVNHQSLPAPEELGQAKESEYIAPRNDLEKQLVSIWEKVLKKHPIGIREDYFELGGSSLSAAQLFTQIEKTLHKKLPLSTLFQAPTIEKQAELLQHGNWAPEWSSLVGLQTSGSKPPIFLAAPVGGNVLSYHDLLMHLPPDQPCYGLQAVGLDGIQVPQKNVGEIVDHYIKEVLTVQPEGPYYLAGSSFGGIVAYEMAQKLHDMGKQIALVIMFDAYGPNYPNRLPSTSRLHRRVFKYLRRIDTHLSNLAYTNWKGRMAYIRVKGKKLVTRLSRWFRERVDQIIHPLPRELKKIKTVHMGAAKKRNRHMREMRRFGGRLVLFRATKQPMGIYPDPTLGWGKVVGEAIEVYEIPGHHTSIIYEPRVHSLADIINRILAEAQSKNSRPVDENPADQTS
ncbi:MAG: amino acid adenylation domain-containing protein [Anaerolineales bacterium]|nr:amino acid adenylation domain-containing protein [Anaerolineales bacterium]